MFVYECVGNKCGQNKRWKPTPNSPVSVNYLLCCRCCRWLKTQLKITLRALLCEGVEALYIIQELKGRDLAPATNTDGADTAWWQLFRRPLANYDRGWQVPKTIWMQTAYEPLHSLSSLTVRDKDSWANVSSKERLVFFFFSAGLLQHLVLFRILVSLFTLSWLSRTWELWRLWFWLTHLNIEYVLLDISKLLLYLTKVTA